MSTIQRSIGLRQLAVTSRLVARPSYARYSTETEAPSKTTTQDKPDVKAAETGLVGRDITEEVPGQATPRHSPDYTVTVDYRTSQFSPIPKRVMDGSEPGDITPAAVLSGAPIDLQARTVRIYKPSKPATQSGTWRSKSWIMDWDPLPKGHRWENPLMGWQSSADSMQAMRIPFKTKEDAINFANKQGYEYFVQEPNERKFIPKAYANNFLHSPKKLKIVRTK